MIVMPAGEFIWARRDGQGLDDERPQHKVTIAKPFAVSKFDVTFADWDACVTGRRVPGYKPFRSKLGTR